ncbi:MAG: GNAT family N-acetyltransferase [Halomonas sp.]|nr:GNAT family N-acetyltransferase [Halomonas sp.]MCC5883913.1 GNAT family N-acetyltransferase [Halomonas sp.]
MLPSRIETERLVLREPRSTDGPLLYQAYTSDPEVTRYLVWRPHQALAETQQFVDVCIQAWQARSHFPYVMTLQRAEHEPIGMLEARPKGHVVEVGYVLARHYWQRGLMPEALSAVTELCLAQPEICRVQATCDVDDLDSVVIHACAFIQSERAA